MTDNILIGKSGPRNQLWILAALTLPYPERVEALNDIAEMLGSTYALVQSQASRIKAKRMADAVQAGYGAARAAYQAAPFRPHGRLPESPSNLRQPSKAELMSGRAR